MSHKYGDEDMLNLDVISERLVKKFPNYLDKRTWRHALQGIAHEDIEDMLKQWHIDLSGIRKGRDSRGTPTTSSP